MGTADASAGPAAAIAARRHRRGCIAPLASAIALALLALPAAAHWQEQVRRIGFLGTDSGMQATRIAAFRGEMKRQGFVEGENLVIEVRWAQGRFEQLPAFAAELVARKPEVIVTAAPPPVSARQ